MSSKLEQIKLEKREEFQDLRFGMFVHFGLYSLGKEHEWHQDKHRMRTTEYMKKFLYNFNPDPKGMEQWVLTAKAMGAKYIICTSKHHDGFCLWDTKVVHPVQPKYHIRSTPFWEKNQKSILDYLFEAGRKHGIKIGLYYSTIDWSFTEIEKKDGLFVKRPQPKVPRKHPELLQKYIDYYQAQLRELAELYPDNLAYWFDGYQFDKDYLELLDYKTVYEQIGKLNSNILLGNNTGKTDSDGPMGQTDFLLFENSAGRGEQNGAPWPWKSELPGEVCLTINKAWGYSEKDKNFKTPESMQKLVLYNTIRNANTLLNFGPTPEGFIAPDQEPIAIKIGELLAPFSDALYETRSVEVNDNGGIIKNRKTNQKYKIEFLPQIRLTNV